MKIPNIGFYSATSQQGLLEALERDHQDQTHPGPFRLAVIEPSLKRRSEARPIVELGKRSLGARDFFFSSSQVLAKPGGLAFLYPGIDSLDTPDLDEVSELLGLPASLNKAAPSIEARARASFELAQAYTRFFRERGITPDACAGHSIGEWTAMVVCGFTQQENADQLIRTFGPGMLPVPNLCFLALALGREKLSPLLAEHQDLVLSHDNCPHQTIVCGPESAILEFQARAKEQGIFSQKLNFKSGFHTPFFQDYLNPIVENFRKFPFKPPHTVLYSATNLEPYPGPGQELDQLMIRHLLEPVRFRDLTEKLYANGYRFFAQMGAGGLQSFVEDTLRQKDFVSTSVLANKRSARESLIAFSLRLWIEGKTFALNPNPQKTKLPRPQLLSSYESCLKTIETSLTEVMQAFEAPAPFLETWTLSLKLEENPELWDHSFYKQPKGNTQRMERFPVMPLTGTIALLKEKAEQRLAPWKVIAVENVRAQKWLSLETDKELLVCWQWHGFDRLSVDIQDHFQATLVLARDYPLPPKVNPFSLGRPLKPKIAVEQVYEEGWLFHGPKFQGLSQFEQLGEQGMRAQIAIHGTRGALLDNVGQLAGIHLMESLDSDRYAMPIRVARIYFYGDEPKQGFLSTEVRCTRVRSRDICYDMQAFHQGKLWVQIESWEKWRFETSEKHWNFLLQAGNRMLSECVADCAIVDYENFSETIGQDLARRYLNAREWDDYQKVGVGRKAWLLGRIAAKDALRINLWKEDPKRSIFPSEIEIDSDKNGDLVFTRLPDLRSWFVALEQSENFAIACVHSQKPLGLTLVDSSKYLFEDLKPLNDSDRRLLSDQYGELDILRILSAKQALARAIGGSYSNFTLSEVKGDRLRIGKYWIHSVTHNNYLLSIVRG